MKNRESDGNLVRRVRAGEGAAFGGIVARYRGALMSVARTALSDAEDAADAVQDAFVLGYLHLHQLQDPERLGAWLRRVTINACRRLARTRRLAIPLDAVPDTGTDHRTAIDARVLVEQALACLSAETRLTVTLYYRREMSLEEIAAFQEVPMTTIKSRLRNARARLRKELEATLEEIVLEETVLQGSAPEDAGMTALVLRRIEAVGGIMSGTISPDGRLFVTGVILESADDTYNARITAWDVETGDPVWTHALTSWFRSVLFTPDGKHVVFSTGLPGHRDGRVGRMPFLDAKTGTVVREIATPKGATALALSPDGCHVAAGMQEEYEDYRSHGEKGVVRLYLLNTGEQAQVLEPHLNYVQALAFSPNGRILASSGIVRDSDPEARNIWLRGDVRVWDLATGAKLHRLERPGAYGVVHSISFSPDGNLLAAPKGPEGEVLLWNSGTGEIAQTLPGFGSQVSGVAFSPDGRLMAAGDGEGKARLFDTATGQLRQTLEGHAHPLRTMAFTPDGAGLITADAHGSVQFWQLRSRG